MNHAMLLLQAAPTSAPSASQAQAAVGAATADPSAPGQGFAPVEGGPEMQSGEALLVEAYAVMWILVLGFVVLAWRRTLAFERRLDALEGALAAARAPAAAAKKPAPRETEEGD